MLVVSVLQRDVRLEICDDGGLECRQWTSRDRLPAWMKRRVEASSARTSLGWGGSKMEISAFVTIADE